jgi:O-acetyl-ADP-ribose deacetylase (regulator of RNase III)
LATVRAEMTASSQHGMLHAVSGVLSRALEDINWVKMTLDIIGSRMSPPWQPPPQLSAHHPPQQLSTPLPLFTVPPPFVPGPPLSSGPIPVLAQVAQPASAAPLSAAGALKSTILSGPPSQPNAPRVQSWQTEQDRQLEKMGKAYQEFVQLEKKQLSESPIPFQFVQNVFELDKDLWKDAPKGAALAHCVGQDLLMTKGVAVEFRERFGNVNYLLAQNKSAGQVATLPVNESYVFYLVTKALTKGDRPTLSNFKRSVEELAHLCTTLGVKTLCMPQIGAGLDRLPWGTCKRIIVEAFQGVTTNVLIFRHPDEGQLLKKNNKKISSPERLYSDALKNENKRASLSEPGLGSSLSPTSSVLEEEKDCGLAEKMQATPKTLLNHPDTLLVSNSFSPLTDTEEEIGEEDKVMGSPPAEPLPLQDQNDNGFSLDRPQIHQPNKQNEDVPSQTSPRETRSQKKKKGEERRQTKNIKGHKPIKGK